MSILDTIYLQQHNIFIITSTFNTIYLWGRIWYVLLLVSIFYELGSKYSLSAATSNANIQQNNRCKQSILERCISHHGGEMKWKKNRLITIWEDDIVFLRLFFLLLLDLVFFCWILMANCFFFFHFVRFCRGECVVLQMSDRYLRKGKATYTEEKCDAISIKWKTRSRRERQWRC